MSPLFCDILALGRDFMAAARVGGCAHDLLQGAGNGTNRVEIILNKIVMESDGLGWHRDSIEMELGFWLEGEFGSRCIPICSVNRSLERFVLSSCCRAVMALSSCCRAVVASSWRCLHAVMVLYFSGLKNFCQKSHFFYVLIFGNCYL